MSRLILHRVFGSPPSRAVLMLSDIIGLKPEIREVNLLKMEHRIPEFLKLPKLLEGLKGPSERHLADIEEAYDFVEAYLSKNKYIACDHLTIADLAVGATAAAMQGILKLDVDKFPRTAEWLALLDKESFFQNIGTPGAEILAKSLQFTWQKNSKQ